MTDTTEYVSVPKVALDWLFGSGPNKFGEWFGDCKPAGAPTFWWRKQFRDMLAAPPPPSPWKDIKDADTVFYGVVTDGIEIYAGHINLSKRPSWFDPTHFIVLPTPPSEVQG